ncbi:MAG: DUF4058 family protein [Planctomycetota bacterium]|nr:DUF4058 family protein [Planctomycetota bacterium]
MPMHDWTRVDAGIYHAFHHSWIEELGRALNQGLLPTDFYALPEQQAAGFGPDVVTLQSRGFRDSDADSETATAIRARPRTSFSVESSAEFSRRKKSTIVVRHVSGDRVVAMIEVISPGNKNSLHALRGFVSKACELLERRIHLLILDPFPPGKRDPHGIHGAIWEELEEQVEPLPSSKRLQFVSYECDFSTRGYIEPVEVGDTLPDMPLFLEPGRYVDVPLEHTYANAWRAMPERWRQVIEAG